MLRTYLVRGLTVLGFVLVLAFVVGALIGQPILFSFVTSGSMSPTIQEGDGFVVVPSQLAGDIGEGDVIVFEAKEIQGGGLTTHRIVEETEAGYITRGDANPFTDQDGGEPPVTTDQIVAVALQPGGDVVTIPYLGTVVLGSRVVTSNVLTAITSVLGIEDIDESRQAGTVLLVSGISLFVLSLVNGIRTRTTRERTRSRGRETIDPRYAALFFIAIVLVPANAAMVLPNTTHQVSVGKLAETGDIEPGENVDVTLSASNEDALVTMLVVFDPPDEGTVNDPWLDIPGGEVASTQMVAPAPPAGENRVITVSERRYIVVLPPTVIVSLDERHPLLAIAIINIVLTFGILTVVLGLLGVRKQRVRTADRDLSFLLALKRKLR